MPRLAEVSHKPDGTPRRFEFIGYKTGEQALAVKEWFHQTFVD
jgi:multiple RNA-binding domain-containing protein 1